jgi:CRP/FNR family transcriptional regulator, dissimilatory nitrate respiration regulator
MGIFPWGISVSPDPFPATSLQPPIAPCQRRLILLDFRPMDAKTIIKSSPLFSGVTAEDLDRLVQVCRMREHEKGDLLFSEGEKALGFFVVGSGRVKIYKLSPEGKERILHLVHPGNTFAEAAIFGSGLYPAYAEPLERSRLVFFPKQDFLALLHAHAQIAINMIGGLSRFLRQFASQIEELTFKDVPSRLARYLLDLSGGKAVSVELPVSKTQLASHLGTVSETLSRTLRKLSDEDLIAVRGKVIEILDAERLADLAETCRE